jgi:hypothetical protein
MACSCCRHPHPRGRLLFPLHARAPLVARPLWDSRRNARIFPLDKGSVHSLGAQICFPCFNLAVLGVATQVDGVLRPLALLAGLVGVGFVV